MNGILFFNNRGVKVHIFPMGCIVYSMHEWSAITLYTDICHYTAFKLQSFNII